MIRLKAIALAGALLIGLLAVVPLVGVAPEAEEDFEDCADNDVCFTVQLTNEEVCLVSDSCPGSFDTWLYVSNPSEDIRREIPVFPDDPPGEDNVVVESLTITGTDPFDVEFAFTLVAGEDPVAERWDPVVHAFETQRVFFLGFVLGFEGKWTFVYELALTFRGESFTLAIDFEIEVVE
ncbi:MAG: hypothetical protein ACE5EW_03325 [Thermoplasmata archaeon]